MLTPSPSDPEYCYAVIMRALRNLPALRHDDGRPVKQVDDSGLVSALPDPGRETEPDRVLAFVEVVCGNLEYWYWVTTPDGEPLSAVAKRGLEPYGGLCDFAFLIARQSDVGSRSLHAGDPRNGL